MSDANQIGLNIPYPWKVPMITTKNRIGFWTIAGFVEEQVARSKGKKGNTLFDIKTPRTDN